MFNKKKKKTKSSTLFSFAVAAEKFAILIAIPL